MTDPWLASVLERSTQPPPPPDPEDPWLASLLSAAPAPEPPGSPEPLGSDPSLTDQPGVSPRVQARIDAGLPVSDEERQAAGRAFAARVNAQRPPSPAPEPEQIPGAGFKPLRWLLRGLEQTRESLMGGSEMVAQGAEDLATGKALEAVPEALRPLVVTGLKVAGIGHLVGAPGVAPLAKEIQQIAGTEAAGSSRRAAQLTAPEEAEGYIAQLEAGGAGALPSVVAQAFLENAPTLLVGGGALRAGKAAGAGAMWLMEGGEQYRQLLASGVPEEEARAGAAVVGAVNAALEAVPMARLLKRLEISPKSAKEALLFMGQQALAEGSTETVQALVSSLDALAQAGEEVSLRELADSGLAGLILGGLTGGAAGVVGSATARGQQQPQKVPEAEVRQEAPAPSGERPALMEGWFDPQAAEAAQRPQEAPPPQEAAQGAPEPARPQEPTQEFPEASEPQAAPLEAMAHAGSGASPEAESRMRGGTRFFEVSPSGTEIVPLIGQEAVDVPARAGRAKVRVSPNGEVIVEQGRLTPRGEEALRAALAEQATPAAAEVTEEGPVELDLAEDADEAFLRSLGVELPGRPATLPQPKETIHEEADQLQAPAERQPQLEGAGAEGAVADQGRRPEALREPLGEQAGRPGQVLPVGRLGEAGAVGRIRRAELLVSFSDPAVEDSYRRSQRRPSRPLPEAIRDSLRAVGQATARMSRPIPSLAPTAANAPAAEAVRRAGQTPGIATETTARRFHRDLGDLSPQELDLFTRQMELDSLRSEVEVKAGEGLDPREIPLPRGWTLELLEQDGPRVQEAVAASPRVTEAVERTRKHWEEVRGEVRDAFADIGLDTAFLDRYGDRYMHHQVLEHQQLAEAARGGRRPLERPKGRRFQRHRRGTTRDISARYIESQGAVLAQMRTDAETARLLRDNVRSVYHDPLVEGPDGLKAKARALGEQEGRKVDWRELAEDVEGHRLWSPDARSPFYLAKTVTDRIAERALREQLVAIGPEDIGQAWVKGSETQWLLPDEVADALDEQSFVIEDEVFRALARFNEQLQRGWKIWALFAPQRVTKYVFRNFVGDASAVFEANPSTFKPANIKRAGSELARHLYGKAEPSPELRDWLSRGGLSAGFAQQELLAKEAERLSWLEREAERRGDEFWEGFSEALRSPARAARGYFAWVRRNAQMAESLLRYASYLDYLAQIKASPEGKPKNWGASRRAEIMGLPDAETKAYWLSNQLVGAYDQVSRLGSWLRREGIPFWSFQEINLRRHRRLIANALRSDDVARTMSRRLLGASFNGVFRVLPMATLRAGRFLAMASALEAFLYVWNHALFPDEEEELPRDTRRRAHVVFGRLPSGEVLYFDRLGVFEEFREWFGIDEFGYGAIDYLNGRKSARDVAEATLAQPISKLVNSLSPVSAPFGASPKLLLELGTKRTTFPSVLRPRPIEDRLEHMARVLALEDVYRAARKKPMAWGGSGWAGFLRTTPNWALYRAEPGSAAYFDTLTFVREWNRSEGRDKAGAPDATERTVALRNVKRALRYESPQEIVDYWLAQYVEMSEAAGIDPVRGYEQSLRMMDPLYGLDEEEQDRFFAWLSPAEKETVDRAVEYYTDFLAKAPEVE